MFSAYDLLYGISLFVPTQHVQMGAFGFEARQFPDSVFIGDAQKSFQAWFIF
jgi:hypothetical protein